MKRRSRERIGSAWTVLVLGAPGAVLVVVFLLVGLGLLRVVFGALPRGVEFLLVGVASYGWSFLLTILVPKAPNWSLAACPVPWFVLGVYIFAGSKGPSGLGVMVLIVSLVIGVTGYAGAATARWCLPRRCRPRGWWPAPGEPCCLGCGYGLYYAKGQTCPECGRRFTFREVDMRRAKWEDGVLKPWQIGEDPQVQRGPAR